MQKQVVIEEMDAMHRFRSSSTLQLAATILAPADASIASL
jgi:hypothetical protein